LSSLKTGSLAKHLAAAGTKIVLPNDVMPALHGLAGVESVGADGASSTVTEAEGIDEILAEVAEEGDSEGNEPVDPSLVGKFVNLIDLIPPLPKKGDFNVQEIKQSPYFFS
jgi:DNA-directed RNA polymerase, mitochondrial